MIGYRSILVHMDASPRTAVDDLGALLLSQAADHAGDLLVVGCYGHHRVRELLLGGVTRAILQSMILPVPMAH
jgi:nucleotide-binding universal stress UspA family protein